MGGGMNASFPITCHFEVPDHHYQDTQNFHETRASAGSPGDTYTASGGGFTNFFGGSGGGSSSPPDATRPLTGGYDPMTAYYR